MVGILVIFLVICVNLKWIEKVEFNDDIFEEDKNFLIVKLKNIFDENVLLNYFDEGKLGKIEKVVVEIFYDNFIIFFVIKERNKVVKCNIMSCFGIKWLWKLGIGKWYLSERGL